MNCQKSKRLSYWVIGICLLASVGCGGEQTSPALAVSSSVSSSSVSSSSVSTASIPSNATSPAAPIGGGRDAIFESPVRFTSPDGPVRVEAPGYASPGWADLDGDGTRELLVGQFRGGKIRVFKSLGDAKVAEGQWLQAGGSVAEVPGVW